MAPFYGWGSTASRLEPLRGGSLLFTIKFPEIPSTHFIDLIRMKYDIHPFVAATQIFISRTKMSDIHVKNYIPRHFIQKAIHLLIFLEKLVWEEN